MSAIFGIISKNDNSKESQFKQMEDSLSVFTFDKFNRLQRGNSFFGCGLQSITPESLYDKFPIYDDASGIVFTSDCFLYNRDNLIAQLQITDTEKLSDSDIAYAAYQKWGFDFTRNLRGCFAFVIYEEKKGLVHLFSDHFTMQYTVYYNAPDYFAFSTTYKPVLASMPKKPPICREFIVNAYRDITPMCFYKEKITPYEGVYHIDYATHVTIDLSTGHETRIRYWNPIQDVKPLKLKSDDEYKARFREIYQTLIKSFLRSSRETGIMLSGGLDSSSVLAFAAPLLNEQGKKIYSYTSKPATDYKQDEDTSRVIVDESKHIMDQKAWHANLEPRFVGGDKDNCLDGIYYYQDFYDMPVKATINNINIDHMYEMAKEDNCSIMLSGGNGNATISYGYITEYMSLNALQLHFIKAYREMSKYCEKYNLSKKTFLVRWIKSTFSAIFERPYENHYFLKPDDEKKYHLTHVALDSKKKFGTKNFVTKHQRNNFAVIPTQYSQKGYFFTYLCLKYRNLQLDPSLTVEMVEFCLSIPLECMVYNGIERRLIRDYLRDLIPESITDMYKGFGAQCADFEFRINRDWDRNREEILSYLDEPLLREYLDPEKIDQMVSELKEAAENRSLDKKQGVELALLSTLACFLKSNAT